jgi:type IV pilus assembly protein PilV
VSARASRHAGPCAPERQRGSSLIEVLVSILILSFGLFALGALQGYAIAGSQTSGYRLQASLLASEAAEILRGHPSAAASGRGGAEPDSGGGSGTGDDRSDGDDPSRPPCRFPDCSAQVFAALALEQLGQRVRTGLPEGRLLVAAAGSGGAVNVYVGWQEPRFHARSEGAPGAGPEQHFDVCPAVWRTAERLPRCLYLRVSL